MLSSKLRDSLRWNRNELLIQCVLIIVYIYGCVYMMEVTRSCYHDIKEGCPRALRATVCLYLCTIGAYYLWFNQVFLFFFCSALANYSVSNGVEKKISKFFFFCQQWIFLSKMYKYIFGILSHIHTTHI